MLIQKKTNGLLHKVEFDRETLYRVGSARGVKLVLLSTTVVILLLYTILFFATSVLTIRTLLTIPLDSDALRNIGLLLIGIVGVPFLLWRSIIATIQTRIQQEGVSSDRYSKAVQQLSATSVTTDSNEININVPDVSMRIGALYALERLSTENPNIHQVVLNTMCAYVRHNAQDTYRQEPPIGLIKTTDVNLPRRSDIYTAIVILGRRSQFVRRYESPGSNCSLAGANLAYSDFDDADFSNANLSFCDLTNCRIENANFSGVYLNNSVLSFSSLHGYNLNQAILRGTDLRKVKMLKQTQIDSAFGVRSGFGSTLLPNDLLAPEHWFEAQNIQNDTTEARQAVMQAYKKWQLSL